MTNIIKANIIYFYIIINQNGDKSYNIMELKFTLVQFKKKYDLFPFILHFNYHYPLINIIQ